MTDPVRMTLHIRIEPSAVKSLRDGVCEITMIPFSGEAEGELFRGTVEPGAADVQYTGRDGRKKLCARYMMTGSDGSGTPCRLYVENKAVLPETEGGVLYTQPCFLTDSPRLSSYFMTHRLYGELRGGSEGPVLLFRETEGAVPDTEKEDELWK